MGCEYPVDQVPEEKANVVHGVPDPFFLQLAEILLDHDLGHSYGRHEKNVDDIGAYDDFDLHR